LRGQPRRLPQRVHHRRCPLPRRDAQARQRMPMVRPTGLDNHLVDAAAGRSVRRYRFGQNLLSRCLLRPPLLLRAAGRHLPEPGVLRKHHYRLSARGRGIGTISVRWATAVSVRLARRFGFAPVAAGVPSRGAAPLVTVSRSRWDKQPGLGRNGWSTNRDGPRARPCPRFLARSLPVNSPCSGPAVPRR
jgi:hypothetical protein